MSAEVQDRPATHTANLDLHGNHLQLHGRSAQHCTPTAMRRMGLPLGLQVMSRFEAKRDQCPAVILHTADAPFTFDWRMSSTEARALAANLLHAADTADHVAAANLKRAKRKAGV